ncbi:MAG: NUDIX domain-containing protein [Candidatus Woesearchaeota archaeon]
MVKTYDEAIAFLYSLRSEAHSRPNIQNITLALEEIGNPQNRYPCIHVTGTNGKGSTCAMLHDMLAKTLKVGLYTSPHLVDYRERIRINHMLIPKQEVVALLQEYLQIIKKHQLTFFEATTLLMFAYFAKEQIDMAVIEVGMGGSWDATNVITAQVCIITRIANDHNHILGNLDGIVKEKSGIIKQKSAVFTLADNYGHDIFFKTTKEKNGSFHSVKSNDFTMLCQEYNLPEKQLAFYQENLCLAVRAVEYLCKKGMIYLEKNQISSALASFSWKGRFQWLEKNLVIDGAHNENGAAWFAKHLLQHKQEKNYQRCILVFGCVKDKDYRAMLKHFEKVSDGFILTMPHNERALHRSLLEQAAKEMNVQVLATFDSVIDVYLEIQRNSFGDQNTLYAITGSLYLLGEFLAEYEELKKQPKIPIVDEQDNLLFYQYRNACKPNDIYRVSALWLTDKKGNILLAKRAYHKAKNPGLWSAAAAGTVEINETYDDNIKKEIWEELGLASLPLIKGPKIRIKGKNNYFCQWYLATVDTEKQELTYNQEEVAEIKWFSPSQLIAAYKENPTQFSPTFEQWAPLLLNKKAQDENHQQKNKQRIIRYD